MTQPRPQQNLLQAAAESEPFMRMKTVVQWYLSGFYKKPKGLKKPYNPIIGETFRCYWDHSNGSKTFYLAEQVSHHPPISSFYATNRQDGFTISGTILAKSKFYGNSTSAILDGVATLSLLARGEVRVKYSTRNLCLVIFLFLKKTVNLLSGLQHDDAIRPLQGDFDGNDDNGAGGEGLYQL